jgi:hypothetical protein
MDSLPTDRMISRAFCAIWQRRIDELMQLVNLAEAAYLYLAGHFATGHSPNTCV